MLDGCITHRQPLRLSLKVTETLSKVDTGVITPTSQSCHEE